MSRKIEEILAVIEIVKRRWNTGKSISALRIDATQIIAQKYRVYYQTICDKYTRGLGIKAKRFDNLLEIWLKTNDKTLQTHLIEKGDANDKSAIDAFFGGYTPSPPPPEPPKPPKNSDEELISLIIEEIVPSGPKRFPHDFLENIDSTDFYKVNLPGIHLRLAPHSKTTIISLKGYFRYPAKNPSEAKYILYSYTIGSKSVKIPKDNLALFKSVVRYEKYCDDVTCRAFELFLDFTYDEDKAEALTREVARRLELKRDCFSPIKRL